MGSAPVGVQCPLTSSLGGSGILGFHPCWYPTPVPSPSISGCFFIHSYSPASGFHSSISHSGGTCTSPPTLLLYPGLEPVSRNRLSPRTSVYPRGYSISISIYLPPRIITTDG